MASGSLLTANPSTAGQPLYTSSTTQYHALGEKMVTSDGRTFRYAKAGGSALVRGNLLQGPAVDTANDSLTPSACAAGSTKVTITCGATTSVANAYAGGYINVCVTPDLGGLYPIKSHPAITSGGAIEFTLYSDHPILTAWTSSTRVDLIPSPYNGVIQAPITTLTGIVVGAAVYEIGASEYGWIQTHGPCSVACHPTGILGSLVGGVPATAGEVAAFTGVYPIVGHLMKVGVDGETVPVFLLLD